VGPYGGPALAGGQDRTFLLGGVCGRTLLGRMRTGSHAYHTKQHDNRPEAA